MRTKELKRAIQNFQESNDPVTLRFHLKNAFSALVSKKDFDKASKSEAFQVYAGLSQLLEHLDPLRKPVKKVPTTRDEFFH